MRNTLHAPGSENGHIALARPSGIRIDLEGYRVWHGSVAVPLTRTECQLLQCLASRPGMVFPRSELLLHMQGQRGRTLDVYICRLRRKLNDHQGAYIQTVRKVGYRLSTGAVAASSLAS